MNSIGKSVGRVVFSSFSTGFPPRKIFFHAGVFPPSERKSRENFAIWAVYRHIVSSSSCYAQYLRSYGNVFPFAWKARVMKTCWCAWRRKFSGVFFFPPPMRCRIFSIKTWTFLLYNQYPRYHHFNCHNFQQLFGENTLDIFFSRKFHLRYIIRRSTNYSCTYLFTYRHFHATIVCFSCTFTRHLLTIL